MQAEQRGRGRLLELLLMNANRLAAAVLACAVTYALVRSERASEPAAAPVRQGTRLSQIARPEYYGLAIQVDSSYRPVERYGAMLREIAALGANTVLLSVNGYQANAGSVDIHALDERNPSDEQWIDLFAIARRERLKVIFMPKILLETPRGSEWRGVIDPGHRWEAWFGQYKDFILHYARLAERCGVEVFVVGSELVSAEMHTASWRGLIADVRKAFPQGRLTYSANWDHYKSIQFWDQLDMIAMSSYYPTAREPNPALEQLMSSWARHQDSILDWQRGVGKPLLFAEVGWCSQEGCSVEPWNYYRRRESSSLAELEQLRNYDAYIQTWQDCPGVAGVMWLEGVPGDVGSADFGYTPKGKPAERLLRRWFRGLQAGRAR